MEVILYLGITVLSGFADAYGFRQASLIWSDGSPSASALVRSAAGYATGMVLYWLALRFIQATGVLSASVQTLVWFTVTIIGVALLSGEFKQWDATAYALAFVAIAAVAGLLVKA